MIVASALNSDDPLSHPFDLKEEGEGEVADESGEVLISATNIR